LLSTQPSAIQAMEATMKITKPATVMRAPEPRQIMEQQPSAMAGGLLFGEEHG
jgi:hypothetical protein